MLLEVPKIAKPHLYERAVGGVYINLPFALSPSLLSTHSHSACPKNSGAQLHGKCLFPLPKRETSQNDGELAGSAAIKTGVQDRDESDEAVQKCYVMNLWPELQSGGLKIRLPSRHMSALGVLKDYTNVLMLASFWDSFAAGV